MSTKKKVKELGSNTDDVVIPIGSPKVDDQTPIDISLNKRPTKDDLQGFDKRLSAGTEREIRIDRDRLGEDNPIMVINTKLPRIVGRYDEIKIEGDSQLVHEINTVCVGDAPIGRVSVRTNASILVKKGKQ